MKKIRSPLFAGAYEYSQIQNSGKIFLYRHDIGGVEWLLSGIFGCSVEVLTELV